MSIEKSTVSHARQQLGREDWIREALDVVYERGVQGVKVVHVAERLNATTGSFYWHFTGVQDLLAGVLAYWEEVLTDGIVESAQSFEGSPAERILELMMQVVKTGAAGLDHPIQIWARTDKNARRVFERTLKKRCDFAAWMFKEAGFDEHEAELRGRLMVSYLMGETLAGLKKRRGWQDTVREIYELIIAPTRPSTTRR